MGPYVSKGEGYGRVGASAQMPDFRRPNMLCGGIITGIITVTHRCSLQHICITVLILFTMHMLHQGELLVIRGGAFLTYSGWFLYSQVSYSQVFYWTVRDYGCVLMRVCFADARVYGVCVYRAWYVYTVTHSANTPPLIAPVIAITRSEAGVSPSGRVPRYVFCKFSANAHGRV
jgi:hypothetical protein